MSYPLRWESHALTHQGAVRTMNEDALLARPKDGFWAVADGMGGHDAGEVASNMITGSLEKIPCNVPLPDLVDSLEDSLLDVHQRIRQYSRAQCDGRTVGSTVVSMLVRGELGVCMWAGDSRLYRLRDNRLEQISEDHSQINEMIARGLLRREEARNHPASNVITRAVGAMETLYLDMTLFELRPGDIYLLCSDGLYGAVPQDMIVQRLQEPSVDQCAQHLIDDALHNGARDNVTVVAIQVM